MAALREIKEMADPSELATKVNEVDGEGLSPLHYAAWYNHAGVVKFLLEDCKAGTNEVCFNL